MNKKMLCLLLMIVSFISINVYAEGTNEWDDQSTTSNYTLLKNGYNSKSKVTVSSTGTTVTLYGRANNCTSNGCTNVYALSNNDNYKDAIANGITCENGEKYFTAAFLSSGKNAYVKQTDQTFTPQVSTGGYWSEDYLVTCSSDSSSSTTPIATSTSSSTSDSSTSDSSTSSTSGYSSSSTTSQESTGINSYFGILALVAVISYIFMICVKKFNLFKNI